VGLPSSSACRAFVLGEKGEIDAWHLRRRDQPAGRQAVLAARVFVHGLEADARMVGESVLAHPRQPPRDASPLARIEDVVLVAPTPRPVPRIWPEIVGRRSS
jgi:hypothetical protein